MPNTERGFDIPKVIFNDGDALPPNSSSSYSIPQNIWEGIASEVRWGASRILGIGTNYQYSEASYTPKNEIIENDSLRETGEKYTDIRGLNSLAGMFSISKKSHAAHEFEGKTVIDIGSGAGVLANDLRKRSNAQVTEVDFSKKAQGAAQPIFKDIGIRILADACDLTEIDDSSFDASISMYSTTVHTETIYRRLKSFTEALRVTKVGGRSYFAPFIGGMVRRHITWKLMEKAIDGGMIGPQDIEIIEGCKSMQQEEVMDFCLFSLTNTLIKSGHIDFRPKQIIGKSGGGATDAVSAICDIKKPLSNKDANQLIDPHVQAFSQGSVPEKN